MKQPLIVGKRDADAQADTGQAASSGIGFHGLVTYHLALLGMLGLAAARRARRS